MAEREPLIEICAADALRDGARGVRFELNWAGEVVPAFAVRHQGMVVGYLNRCAHIAMELDWQPGDFFEPDAEFIVCATHGALYDPATGQCRGGACVGHGNLRPLPLVEIDGRVYLRAEGD